MMIAADRTNGEGKRTTARFLACELRMPSIETDLFMTGTLDYDLRLDDLSRVLQTRLSCEAPLIVEGLFLLRTLERVNLMPDVLVCVQRVPPNDASLLTEPLESYRQAYGVLDRADYLYRWSETPN